MHGSYNRFMIQHLVDEHNTERRKMLVSKVDPNKPGASIDVEVTADGLPGTANGGEIVDGATGLGKSDDKFFLALAKDVLGR